MQSKGNTSHFFSFLLDLLGHKITPTALSCPSASTASTDLVARGRSLSLSRGGLASTGLRLRHRFGPWCNARRGGGEERERFILENDWVHIKFDFFFSVIFFFFIHSDRGNLHQLSFGHLISQNKVQRDNLRSESFKRRIIFSYVTDLWRHSWLLLTCIKL